MVVVVVVVVSFVSCSLFRMVFGLGKLLLLLIGFLFRVEFVCVLLCFALLCFAFVFL